MDIKYITVVNDFIRLNTALLQSPGINKDNIIIIDNTLDNRTISYRYNSVINELLKDPNPEWLVFCHQDFRFNEDILPRLLYLDKNYIYGPIGISSNSNILLGRIIQTNNKPIGIICNECDVDTIDAMCMIVNKDIIREYNLSFDENFRFHFYVEDFCLQAREKDIKTKTLQMNCQHMSRALRGDINSLEFHESRNILIKKWGSVRTTTGTYTYIPQMTNVAIASIIILSSYIIYKEYHNK